MHYTIHQLNVFLTIVECESVTKAADVLHLSQPAVSIQLKNFQDQFDIPLTETVGRKLYITEFGKEIARSAQLIIDEIHAIEQKTMAHRGFLTGKLKLATVSTGKYILPHLISGFTKLNPGIDLVLDVTNKSQVNKQLEENDIDFALVSTLPDLATLEKIELFPNKLFLITNPNMGLNRKRQDLKLLSEIPLIFREKGSGTRELMTRFLRENKILNRKQLELTSNEGVKQAILAGLGCSIMPLIGLKHELRNKELEIVPIKKLPLISTWNLIWIKNKRLSPSATEFLHFTRKNITSIVQNQFGWYNDF